MTREERPGGRGCAARYLRLRGTATLPFLESVPEMDTKLKEPNAKDEAFEEVVKSAQAAAVLVLVY
jgi:hypothetical protein